jgi:hypothetical protein
MRLFTIMLLSGVVMVTACKRTPTWDGSLESLLNSHPERFGAVMKDPEKYRIQIMYTQIDRDTNNKPRFKTYTYRVDPSEYFYPASTVKLPTAALALEKLNRLNLPGLDRDSTMLTGAATDFQTEVLIDKTSSTGLPSVAQYVKRILLVSDNDAFNRLYEFVGPKEINESLKKKSFFDTRIVHRLEVPLDREKNQWTNPVQFKNGDVLVYEQADVRNQKKFYPNKPERLGIAEIVNGERLERPKDFSEKNSYPLLDQHGVLKNLMFPDSVSARKRFDLSESDYQLIYRYMSMYPEESHIQAYKDPEKYPQGYVKFLMYGGDEKMIPSHIRIFNKVGDAYGFLTDAAYIVDFKHNVEFLLTATIYTNASQTFNDNEYEYDEIGLPFLRNLGQAIYEIELARLREHKPDLSRFSFPDRNY